jgi:hypothetical protein
VVGEGHGQNIKFFTIQITYMTGNSFGSYEKSDELPIPFESLLGAKDALGRIKAHYEVYANNHGYTRRKTLSHEEYKTKLKQLGFVSSENDSYISLQLEDGTEQQIEAFWCGYFETLCRAEIIVPHSDLVYEPE